MVNISGQAQPPINRETEIGIVFSELLLIETRFGQTQVERTEIGGWFFFGVLPQKRTQIQHGQRQRAGQTHALFASIDSATRSLK